MRDNLTIEPLGAIYLGQKPMAKFFAFVILSFLPLFAYGALVPTPSLTPVISASPSYQTPGTLVTLRVFTRSSEGLFLYSWSVDGVELASGVDLEEITVTAGAAGESKVVRVQVTNTESGTSGQATYIIRPAVVDLVWEGNTYTPPLYLGKAFPTGESEIVVEAIPQMQVGDELATKNNLIFNWEVDGEKRKSSSGYGKSVFRTSPTKFRYSTVITVTVSTPDDALSARSSVSIPTRSPGVIIYEEKPLAGTWFTKAVPATAPLTGDEITFRAVPFFVVNPQALTYTWTLNREPFATAGEAPSLAVFRKTGEGTGEFPVGVTIQKTNSIFERASASFRLAF